MTDNLAPNSSADMRTQYKSRIGVVADIHWGDDEEEQLEHHMESVVNHFNTMNVDCVVSLGDMIQEGETRDESFDRIKTVRSYFGEINSPVYELAGNHDVMNLPLAFVTNQSFGETRWKTFTISDDTVGILLDTSSPEYPDARGKIGEKQLEFLDKELEDANQAVVFSHHPLYYYELDDENFFSHHPEAAFCSDKYLANEIMEKHGNVIATINGHTHLSHHNNYKSIPRFTINAFNKEKVGNKSPNGSFAILEVSPKRVRRISHRNGSFDTTDEVKYPMNDQHVAIGGTFDPVHDGHRQMFQRAFEVGDLTIGLTSDTLAPKTRHTGRTVKPFDVRKELLNEELERFSSMYERDYTIEKLDNPMGIVSTSEKITHLIVSPETFSRGEKVNEERLSNSLEPLSLEVVDPVLAEDGQRISSTRIRNGEIDKHGNIVSDE